MTSLVDTWAEVLDEMERRLERCRAGVADGRFSFEPVVPPPGLGPVPPTLGARVAALRAATVALEEDIEVMLAELSGRLGVRPALLAGGRPSPSYVDRRA